MGETAGLLPHVQRMGQGIWRILVLRAGLVVDGHLTAVGVDDYVINGIYGTHVNVVVSWKNSENDLHGQQQW